ncbi:MAG: phosphatase PAP2 family protein [Prevotella sp.]|nr:phosphatase PAP2 family protein [Prevotella sp.]
MQRIFFLLAAFLPVLHVTTLPAQEAVAGPSGLSLADTVVRPLEVPQSPRPRVTPSFPLPVPSQPQGVEGTISPTEDPLRTVRIPDQARPKHPFAFSTASFSTSVKAGWKPWILPVSLIGFGFWGNGNDWFEHQNDELREELQENIDHKITLDDYSQFAPFAAVYALGWAGVAPRHDFRTRALVGVMAFGISQLTVQSLKYAVRKERPDHSARNSFPSGHTTMAFLGAEMLWQEYRDVSPWIGYAGYAVAAGTGFFRMYNNRHWFSDVIAGAGFGMLSAKLAYWLSPKVFRPHGGKSRPGWDVTPFAADGGGLGLSMAVHL